LTVSAASPSSSPAPRPKGASPRAKRKPAPPAAERLAALICASLADDKAEDIVTLDLRGRASFAECRVIASGLADRHIEAMATHLVEKLHALGLRRVPVEGGRGASWLLIDAGDVIVHLFKPETRKLYNLEKMWGMDLDGSESQAT
jgi:ribosome-associated protein